jgi:hypothetical protein
MLEVRNILYFTPFYFKNSKEAKNKFFVVLKHIDNNAILASLPTSVDSIPAHFDYKESGCIEIPSANFNCFVIKSSTCVTECGKFFDKNTFLYGHLLNDYDVANIQATYQIENVNFSIFGKMEKQLFDKLIDCFKNSKSIKRKYKKVLSS